MCGVHTGNTLFQNLAEALVVIHSTRIMSSSCYNAVTKEILAVANYSSIFNATTLPVASPIANATLPREAQQPHTHELCGQEFDDATHYS